MSEDRAEWTTESSTTIAARFWASTEPAAIAMRNLARDIGKQIAVLEQTIGKLQRDLSELRSDLNEQRPVDGTFRMVRGSWTSLEHQVIALRDEFGMTPATILQEVARYLYAKDDQ